MNIRTEFFLAWRYLKPKRNAVSVITCISVIGVTLGVGVLIVVLAVMTGFTDLMKNKLLETTAHIQIYDYAKGYISDPAKVIAKAKECGMIGAPVTYTQILLQKDDKFVPKAAIGIDPKNTGNMDVAATIRYGQYSLEKGEALISQIVAQELDAHVGDKILIHAPDKLSRMIKVKEGGGVELSNKADVYLPEEFKIAAIYSFGKYDFDKQIIFMNIDDADELCGLPWGACSVIYGWTKDPFSQKTILNKLKEKLSPMIIRSWKEMNQKLLGVLAVEKNMMFFLLIFIVLVAAFSIANTLITVVIQKTREIGLLKALGATSGGVMRVFIMQGFFVGVIGTIIGELLGITVIYWRNSLMEAISAVTGMELFPKEFYFFNELPAHIVPQDLIVIGIISILLCTLGGVIPAARAALLDPAKALRYE